MRYQGINLGNVKISNRESILKLLNNQGAMSRKDITEKVGLTAAGVTLICNELLEAGVILEMGEVEEERRVGRKKILVDINKDYKKVLCIGIETNETYITVTDLKGNDLGNVCLLTDANGKAEEFLTKVTDEAKKLLWEKGIPKEQLLGVGVSVPGKVDRQKGLSINSYSIWTNTVEIGAILEKALDLPVVVENNVKALAESEILFGHGRDNDHMFLLKWGPGVGSAIIINNQIYQGSKGMAAEIGHMTASVDGEVCRCGKRGCLETKISTHAIIESIEEVYETCENPAKDMPVLHAWLEAGNSLRYSNVVEWGILADSKLQEIIDEKIDRLALAICNVKTIIDPDSIILTGYLFEVPEFKERLLRAYKCYDPNMEDTFFIDSEVSKRLAHREALALALNEFFFLN